MTGWTSKAITLTYLCDTATIGRSVQQHWTEGAITFTAKFNVLMAYLRFPSTTKKNEEHKDTTQNLQMIMQQLMEAES